MFALTLATPQDLDEAFRLYRRCADQSPYVWSDDYPYLEIVEEDIALGALYLLRDDAGRLLAAGALRDGEELRHLPWNPAFCRPCELSRLGVDPDCQRQGLGSRMLSLLLQKAASLGFDGMILLASTENPPALALYRRLGFETCGETHCYDTDFSCMQRAL